MDRRDFLKSAAAVPAAAVTLPAAAPQPPSPVPEASTIARPGSDFMVDILKSLDFEYAFSNPANTFRSLHESIINYGGNTRPEFITCTHEEIATAMAHGYAKIEGRPALVAVHGTVGTQHATMAVYDAFCDRVPVYLILGNHLDAMGRRSVVTWSHSAQDAAAILRDFTKWDDAPGSLAHFAESAVRAYKIATTPPMAPVAIVADADLQEHPCAEGLRIPKLAPTSPPQGDAGAVAEVARLLVAAENPVIVVDRMARTPAGLARLVELADLVQAAVVDRKGRMNFPLVTRSTRRIAPRRRWPTPISSSASKCATSPARSRGALGATRVAISADDLFTPQQLPGVPALRRIGSGDRRRWRSDAAGDRRSREEADHRRSAPRLRRAPGEAGGGARRGARRCAGGGGAGMGLELQSAPRGCAPKSGRRSRMPTGRSSPT